MKIKALSAHKIIAFYYTLVCTPDTGPSLTPPLARGRARVHDKPMLIPIPSCVTWRHLVCKMTRPKSKNAAMVLKMEA